MSASADRCSTFERPELRDPDGRDADDLRDDEAVATFPLESYATDRLRHQATRRALTRVTLHLRRIW